MVFSQTVRLSQPQSQSGILLSSLLRVTFMTSGTAGCKQLPASLLPQQALAGFSLKMQGLGPGY